MCGNVPSGAIDPTGACVNQVGTCGTNGRCNGAGNCALYDTTTVCGGSCAPLISTFTTLYCDGLGSCLLTMPQVCANGCDGNGCVP
jgi:hypothetical protein